MTSGFGIAVFVVLAIAGVLGYILFGMTKAPEVTDKDSPDVENIPAPNTGENTSYLATKEVFHISDNTYSYNDAAPVCAAYGAELATYDQIVDAHVQGAEWCNYGWSAAAMALFPTQQKTWEKLQYEPQENRRTACGHPGVNGGYFDTRLKFGVNCYGKKPPNVNVRLPQPLPGGDQAGFDAAVNKFKAMLTSMKLSPFNRSKWSLGNWSGSVPDGAPKAPPSAPAPVPDAPPANNAQSQAVPSTGTPTQTASQENQVSTLQDMLCRTFGIGCPPGDKPADKPTETYQEFSCRTYGIGCPVGPNSEQKTPGASANTAMIDNNAKAKASA